jgi:hypothetical protein
MTLSARVVEAAADAGVLASEASQDIRAESFQHAPNTTKTRGSPNGMRSSGRIYRTVRKHRRVQDRYR